MNENTFAFTETEREYLTEMRAIVTDSQGREVLCGLTFAESDFYMSHVRARESGNRDHNRDNRDAFLLLHDKHERARLEILGAEIYIRNEAPPMQ